MSSVLPQFETGVTTNFGKRQGPSTERKIVNISDLLQGLFGLTSVLGPFQDATDVANLADTSRFVTLVPTTMAGRASQEGKILGVFFKLCT